MKNNEDALDVTQETFIEVFKSIHQLKEPLAFKGWLYAIVLSKCTKIIRKKKVETTNFSDTTDVENTLYNIDELNPIPTPENLYLKKELKDFLLDIIDSLPPKQANVLLLRYFHNLSIYEISIALECPTGTVKSRIRLAKQKLKESILIRRQKGTSLYSISFLGIIIPRILTDDAKKINLSDIPFPFFEDTHDEIEILDNLNATTYFNSNTSVTTIQFIKYLIPATVFISLLYNNHLSSSTDAIIFYDNEISQITTGSKLLPLENIHRTEFDPLDGITVIDDRDKNLVPTVEGTVDLQAPGTYELKYKVIDSDGNITTAERKVTVTKNKTIDKPPIINTNDEYIDLNTSFNPIHGIELFDDVDNQLLATIIGKVDSSTKGRYKIEDIIEDSVKNISSTERIITVR